MGPSPSCLSSSLVSVSQLPLPLTYGSIAWCQESRLSGFESPLSLTACVALGELLQCFDSVSLGVNLSPISEAIREDSMRHPSL